MKIAQNKVVEFCYELEVEGAVVDQTTKERPLDYIHGTGSLLLSLRLTSKAWNQATDLT